MKETLNKAVEEKSSPREQMPKMPLYAYAVPRAQNRQRVLFKQFISRSSGAGYAGFPHVCTEISQGLGRSLKAFTPHTNTLLPHV